MNIIKNYFQIYKVEDKIILGRWGYTKNIEELDKKIYLSNHDNCGPCGYVNKDNSSLFNS
tara:strand:- start:70 stop:249 length:180 start_codon:yes stop_codon:yes gene_type:complete